MAIFEIKFRCSAEAKSIEADYYQEAHEGFISFYKDFEGVGYQQIYMVRLSEILSVERCPWNLLIEVKLPTSPEDVAKMVEEIKEQQKFSQKAIEEKQKKDKTAAEILEDLSRKIQGGRFV
jgi:hypothetical protein